MNTTQREDRLFVITRGECWLCSRIPSRKLPESIVRLRFVRKGRKTENVRDPLMMIDGFLGQKRGGVFAVSEITGGETDQCGNT